MEETRNREKISEPKEVIVIEVVDTQFAHYAVITPEAANLPADILQAIPYEQIQNSVVGTPPENLWQQISGAIGGAITSVVNFIYHGIVALANLIEQAISLGIGTFIGSLVGVAMMAVMEKVFEDNNKYEKIGLPRPSLDFDSVWSGIEEFLNQKPVENFMKSLLEALISTWGFVLSLPAVSEAAKDASGTSASMLSFTTGFFSLVVAYIATALSPLDPGIALGAGSLGVALGIESVALGLWSIIKSPKLTSNEVLSLIGISLSMISIILFFKL